MTKQACRLFAILLEDGMWWKRGGGSVPGGPVESFKYATMYKNVGAATKAAKHIDENTYGGWEVVEFYLVRGNTKVAMVRE